ncbi:MAG TPA: LON peptidase substrate-binding domain-containing protein [Candidatus Binataceae bacterium]|jgi:Lon protease-like protein|nr:LON peptidase substrate-binding domain-containing protein [Candidatus Binataceae bacterium]
MNRIIPLFPLPNLVLFPHTDVPLHIFEPRYRQMIADVAEGERIVGMTLLKDDWERDYYANPDIYTVGCAGKIDKLVQMPNGRYNLILQGLSEFKVTRELRDRPYRQAEVEWCGVPPESLAMNDQTMTHLRELLLSYIGEPAKAAWRTVVEERGLRGAQLVNFLCFHLDLSPLEKQTLLEALDQRATCLLDVLTFKLAERNAGPMGQGGGESGTRQ